MHADAPFVGRLAQRDGGVLVYRVQVRVKGHLTRRMRVHGLRGCGVSLRTGLLLDRRHGVWVATAAVKPGALLNAAGIGP